MESSSPSCHHSGGIVRSEILAWIRQFARPNISSSTVDYSSENDDEETTGYNFVSDIVNNDCNKVVKEVRINGQLVTEQQQELHGEGSLTFDTEDYFRGEFFGSVGDREGSLIKVSQGGAVTYGVWRNGLLQVI